MTDRPRLVNANAPAPGQLGPTERNLCLLASTVLVANGLRQGGAAGLAQLAAGALAGWRGWHGQCPVKARLNAAHAPLDTALASAVAVRSITLDQPLEQVLAFCSNPANIGELLPWVDTIEQTAPGLYRWAIRGPGERTLHWALEQHLEPTGDGLRWHSPAGSRWPVEIQASLRVPRHGKGTQLRILLSAAPLPGKAGQAFGARLGAFANTALLELLQRVRQVLDTGEAAPQNPDANDFLFVHPATPK